MPIDAVWLLENFDHSESDAWNTEPEDGVRNCVYLCAEANYDFGKM